MNTKPKMNITFSKAGHYTVTVRNGRRGAWPTFKMARISSLEEARAEGAIAVALLDGSLPIEKLNELAMASDIYLRYAGYVPADVTAACELRAAELSAFRAAFRAAA